MRPSPPSGAVMSAAVNLLLPNALAVKAYSTSFTEVVFTSLWLATIPPLFNDSKAAVRTGSGYDLQTSWSSCARLVLSQVNMLDCNVNINNNNDIYHYYIHRWYYTLQCHALLHSRDQTCPHILSNSFWSNYDRISFITTQVTHISICSGRTVPNNMRKWSQRCRPLWDFAAHSSIHHQRYGAWQHETVHHCLRLCEDRTGDATASLSQEASTQLTPAQWQNLYNIKWCDANTLKTDYNHSSSR